MKRPTTPRTLTPEAITTALDSLGWKQSDLARRCGVAPVSVSRWCTGKAPAPLWLSEYLQALLALRELHSRFLAPLPPDADDPQPPEDGDTDQPSRLAAPPAWQTPEASDPD